MDVEKPADYAVGVWSLAMSKFSLIPKIFQKPSFNFIFIVPVSDS